MANSIVESIMSLVTPQLAGSLASKLGASPTTVQSGLGTSIAALLGGLASRAGDSGFIGQIFNMVSGSNSQSILSSLPNLISGTGGPVAEQGSKLTSMLFGGQQSKVEGLIGQQSGLGAGAGSMLLSLAAPLVTGFLGQQIREKNLNASSFANLLSSEGSKIQGMLPAGLGSLLGGGTVAAATGAATSAIGNKAQAVVPAKGGGGMKALLAILGIILLALIAWFASRGCNKPQPAPTAPAETAAPAPVPAAPAAGPLGEFIKRKLPDGTELNIPRLGVENKLIDFIEDSSKPVDKTTWFDFDRLTFDTGKTTLDSASGEQLQNIAAIMKAYPKVKLKIGGYTDNTGNKAANLKLSQGRAMTVQDELEKLGVEKSRLEAQGYGEEHPVADNSTEEGRAKNRRISLRVTAK